MESFEAGYPGTEISRLFAIIYFPYIFSFVFTWRREVPFPVPATEYPGNGVTGYLGKARHLASKIPCKHTYPGYLACEQMM